MSRHEEEAAEFLAVKKQRQRADRALRNARSEIKANRLKLIEVNNRLTEALGKAYESRHELGLRIDDIEVAMRRLRIEWREKEGYVPEKREVWVHIDGRRIALLSAMDEDAEYFNSILDKVRASPDPYQKASELLTLVTNEVTAILREVDESGG